ncbi:MAG: NUDIX hydrolase [Microbacteriaceae bacterium]|nr:NUDIX hydrolase [Microbacteriaceae bacterium]MCL2795436.1 NUDIX hydrolase [Microbacteriaceae bacterium]
MTTALAVDDRGQRLTRLWFAAEPTAAVVDGVPCPLALVVLLVDGAVLFGLNRWRREWELPGGMIEAGETPRAAARRELHEETGVALDEGQLEWRGLAAFELLNLERTEYAAIYSATVDARPHLEVSNELIDLRWLDPASSESGVSTLDRTIAQSLLDEADRPMGRQRAASNRS